MYKIVIRTVFLVAIIFATSSLSAQLLDSLALDTLHEFQSLQEAMKNPDAVVKLVLRKQRLKVFPKEILQMKNLQYLDLSKNSIPEIPDSIDVLSNLQYLAVSKSGLKHVTKDIGKLTNLKYLNLNQNDLESLPPQIANLEKLEILDLWSNNFENYPSFSNLKSLKVLDLRNILISDEVQKSITNSLPNTKVYLSPSCRCKW
ncbi:MAG: Leucine Rich Repeat (LRR)-containing protein [Bacteroidota bacterium]|jgi:Leucine-rich repeat (LRR) protein|nr:Leucine Rich Repeat (LRR)-containing protein [Bacteroidota bacterium]